jgi:Cofilin/tropomyosin-type actin-binding protein.
MTKGFATITPECEEVFDEVKGTDNLNYVIYEASAHDKKITVAESGKYKDYAEFLSHFKDNTPPVRSCRLHLRLPCWRWPAKQASLYHMVCRDTLYHPRH